MEAQREQTLTETNRRSERRQRVYKQARIIFNNGYAVFDCIVRNISQGGAMLEMETLLGIPRSFQVIVDHGGGSASLPGGLAYRETHGHRVRRCADRSSKH